MQQEPISESLDTMRCVIYRTFESVDWVCVEQACNSNCLYVDLAAVMGLVFDRALLVGTPPQVRSRDLNSDLELLARFVAYDYVIVDVRPFLEHSQLYDAVLAALPRGGLVKVLDFPKGFHDLVCEEVCFHTDAAFAMRTGRRPSTLQEKHADNSIADLIYPLAHLFMARRLGAPFFLSDGDAILRAFSVRFQPEALRLVEERVDRAVLARAQALIRAAYQTCFTFEVPPLADHIWETARRKRLSLLDATLEIREQPEAEAFRCWLGRINRSLMRGGRSGLLKASREIETIAPTLEAWGKSLVVEEGLRFKRSTIKLEAIPVVGWLARSCCMASDRVRVRAETAGS